MKWVHGAMVNSFEEMTNLGKDFRENLSRTTTIHLPEVTLETASADGTRKFLLELADGEAIETVLIPGPDHDTLCVSSQVGCAMGCRFCRTAGMGFIRNLTSAEIVGQLLRVRRASPGSHITNIVFMGMGEPLANLDNVARAIRIMTSPNGPQISWRHLTVSTCGLVPQIRQLGETVRAKLAVSLNATTDEQRCAIMPINKKYPIAELMRALAEYPLPRRDRITIEYALIRGHNDSDADAKRLVRLLNPIRAKVNLIPLNDDAVCDLKSSLPERAHRFQKLLMSKSLMAIIRKSRGRDILAACGQLAADRGKAHECSHCRSDSGALKP